MGLKLGLPRQRPSESQVTRLAFEEFLRELPVRGRAGFKLGKKSTCKQVLGRPAPCAAGIHRIAQHVMCNAFHSPTNLSGRENLVEHFRKNVRSAWSRYRTECQVSNRKKYR